MPPCHATGTLSELEHGWITRPDGRPGTPMRRRGRAALAAGAKEKATDTYLTLERRDTSDGDGEPPAAGPHSGARPRPPASPPCGVPAGFLRRKLCWLRRGVPGEEEVVGGETKRRRGPQGQGENSNYLPRRGRRDTGGTPFIPYPAVTPGDRNRGARDRGACGGTGACATT